MRSNNTSPRRVAARLAVLGAATTALLTAVCAQTQAADGPAGIPDYQGARQILKSAQVHDTVSRFLVAGKNTGSDGGQAGAPMPATGDKAAQDFDIADPVPLYELAPGFVTGTAKDAPSAVARLSYAASRVQGADGRLAAVLLAPQAKGGSWQMAGIRDGDSDIAYAEKTTKDATVFNEPQIHAWYRLKDDIIWPLNREAVSGLGGKRSMPLVAYQKLVHGRYAGKLPGSGYDRKGMAGGYGPTASAHDSTSSSSSSPSSAPMIIGGSGAALALVGGTVAVGRHRRRSQVN